jgi:cytoskeletal protein CcmA (bactofilin family)
VVLGPTSVVDAEIEATVVSISGTAAGSIKVRDRVEIFTGATVTSSLVTPSLKIADGAVFQGHCEMNPGGKFE